MNNLRNRGVEDILIAVVDGLKGFPDAINAAFPDTTVQTCIVHLVRHSLNFCGWKDRKVVAKDLKRIYQAVDDEEAAKALDDFEAEWGAKYPSIAPSWRRAWQEVIPFFAFPPAVRKIIYTTNAIESLNRVIRKTTKTRGSFPTDDAATKLIYLAIRKFEKAGGASGNGLLHETSSLSYTQNGSTDDPFQPHGLSLIHRVSDTPLHPLQSQQCSHCTLRRGTDLPIVDDEQLKVLLAAGQISAISIDTSIFDQKRLQRERISKACFRKDNRNQTICYFRRRLKVSTFLFIGSVDCVA